MTIRRLAASFVLILTALTAPAVAQDGPEAETESTKSPALTADLPTTKPASEKAVRKLRDEIDGIVERKFPPAMTAGIYAVDTSTGQVLYANNAETPLNPASNMKLITSAAALDTFEPQHTFSTRIIGAQPDDGVVDGPLHLVGEGEAFLLFEDFIKWAAKLKLKGVTSVKDGIVVDDTAFDENYLPPAFGQKDEDDSFRSPIGAVSVNFNAVTVIVEPGKKSGDEPTVRFYPPNDHLKVDVRARTVNSSGADIEFSSDPNDAGGTTIAVDGAIGTRSEPARERLRIDNPPAFAGSVLKKALEMVGVRVGGTIRRGKAPDTGRDDADVLVSHYSQPLSYVILAMNKWSNNFMAEQLLRTMGRDGDEPSTWKHARNHVRNFLKKAGLDLSQVTLKNGSGLYDGNAVSPKNFVRLLTYMLDHRARPEYVASLAVAGMDGTLKGRLDGPATEGTVRAKTGTLNDVSALSGYLKTESGRLVAFSILLNDTPKKAWLYRPAQDEIVEALAGFDG